MSVADILDTYGPWRLAAFLLAVAIYLALHLTRFPFVLVAKILAAAQRGLDQRITTSITRPTPGGTRARA